MNKLKEKPSLCYFRIVTGKLKFEALVETVSSKNALSMRICNQIENSFVSTYPTSTSEFFTATGQKERCLLCAKIPFRIGIAKFKSQFPLMQQHFTPILEAPFLSENNLMVNMK